jgi:DHA3 family tetracycline resistance protein-like MFS transporter
MVPRLDARRVYLGWCAIQGLGFTLIVTVNLIYQATAVGLSAFQLVLAGTVLGEVPTGVVADVFSRRLSIIIGVALTGIGFTIEGLVPSLSGVLTGSVLFGLGAVFCSGAEQAWLNDELGEQAAGAALLEGSQAWNVARLVGIPLAIILAQISISFPIVAGGLVQVAVALGLTLLMPERNFHRTPAAERETWSEMRDTLRAGTALVRRRPDLRRLVLIAAVVGAYSEGFDRLSTAHYLRDVGVPGGQRPVVWLGGLMAVEAMLGVVLAGRLARRLEHRPDGAAGPLGAAFAVLSAATAVFALTRRFGVAAGAGVTGGVARVVEEPLFQACLNTDLESRSRATVISFASQSNAFGQIVGGLMLGVVASTAGIGVAIGLAALVLAPVPLLLRGLTGPRPRSDLRSLEGALRRFGDASGDRSV